jgi:hypothetical protein
MSLVSCTTYFSSPLRISAALTSGAACFTAWFVLALILTEPESFTTILYSIAVAFLALLLLPTTIILALNGMSHFGASYKLNSQGLNLGNIFSTHFIPWERLQIFNAYNAYRNSKLLFDFGSVFLHDTLTKKRIFLWPYLIPDCVTLVAAVEHHLALNLSPRLLERYYMGDRLKFGRLSLVQSEIAIEIVPGQSERIPLDSIIQIRVVGNALTIDVRNHPTGGVYASLKRVPNVRVLSRLLRSLGVQVVEQGSLEFAPIE